MTDEHVEALAYELGRLLGSVGYALNGIAWKRLQFYLRKGVFDVLRERGQRNSAIAAVTALVPAAVGGWATEAQDLESWPERGLLPSDILAALARQRKPVYEPDLLDLVRYHGRPPPADDRKDPEAGVDSRFRGALSFLERKQLITHVGSPGAAGSGGRTFRLTAAGEHHMFGGLGEVCGLDDEIFRDTLRLAQLLQVRGPLACSELMATPEAQAWGLTEAHLCDVIDFMEDRVELGLAAIILVDRRPADHEPVYRLNPNAPLLAIGPGHQKRATLLELQRRINSFVDGACSPDPQRLCAMRGFETRVRATELPALMQLIRESTQRHIKDAETRADGQADAVPLSLVLFSETRPEPSEVG